MLRQPPPRVLHVSNYTCTSVLLCLQAGLSWSTILAKRQAYRTAFDGFDPRKVAVYNVSNIEQLMSAESGVVRHRGKLEGAVRNAK